MKLSRLRPKFERETKNGWNQRYLYLGRILIGWATTVPGEPWEGPWIGLRFHREQTTGARFVRFGVRGFACALGIAK